MDFDIPSDNPDGTPAPARRLLEHHNLSASEYYAETTVSFGYTEAGESNAGLVLGIIGTSLAGLIILWIAAASMRKTADASDGGAKLGRGTYTPVPLRTHYA